MEKRSMFLNSADPLLNGEGPRDAKIAIVGEAWGAYEERTRRPFQGPAGSILEQCLHSAGLIRSQVYVTNVVNLRPPKNDITPYWTAKGGFTERAQPHLERLQAELAELKATVLVPMGNVPCYALINRRAITSIRGYPFDSVLVKGRTVLPCIHPAAALRGKYIWRYYITHDLMRARRYAEGNTLPNRDLITDLTFDETVEWLKAHMKQRLVSFDIEVAHYQVSCISFSSKSNYAISIPMLGVWSLEEETYLWKLISDILENPDIIKVGQNLSFDVSFLATKNRIIVRGAIHDTMVAHSVMYPDFEKSLAFLASIYTDTKYWKDLVKFRNIKEES